MNAGSGQMDTFEQKEFIINSAERNRLPPPGSLIELAGIRRLAVLLPLAAPFGRR